MGTSGQATEMCQLWQRNPAQQGRQSYCRTIKKLNGGTKT